MQNDALKATLKYKTLGTIGGGDDHQHDQQPMRTTSLAVAHHLSTAILIQTQYAVL